MACVVWRLDLVLLGSQDEVVLLRQSATLPGVFLAPQTLP
jgi:hypothetical protein